MAPAFLFKFGAVDLSQYVRVNAGEGMDPSDGDGFEEPQFQTGPFAEGQPLSNVDVQNRQSAWPLFLNASSKDALHQLKFQINREIRYGAKPLVITWQDAGASNPTYYDVSFARFDEEFSYRRSAKGWLAGVLHVWSQPPYGHTATERVLGTVTASLGNAVGVTPLASQIGDVDGLLKGVIGLVSHVPSANFAPQKVISGMAVLPYGYISQFPAASIMASTALGYNAATVYGDKFSVASQVLRQTFTTQPPGANSFGPFVLPAGGSVYEGRNRVFALVRHSLKGPSSVGSLCMWAANRRGIAIGPTAVLATTFGLGNMATGPFYTLDLGVWDVDTTVSPSQILTIWGGFATTVASVPGTGTAGLFMELGALVVLPEDKTVIFSGESVYQANGGVISLGATGPVGTYTFDGVLGKLLGERNEYKVELTDKLIGPIPKISPVASMQIAAFVLPQPGDYGSIGTQNFNLEVRVRERFTQAR